VGHFKSGGRMPLVEVRPMPTAASSD
jgi:hypothetical protein